MADNHRGKFFEDKIIPKIFNALYTGLLFNSIFVLISSPFLLNIILIRFSENYSILFPISIFFLFSAIYILYASYNNWYDQEEKLINLKSSFRCWRQNLRKISIQYIGCGLIVLANVINITRMRNSDFSFMNISFAIIIGIVLMIYSLWLFLIIKNPQAKLIELGISSFYFMIKKIGFSLINAILLTGLIIGLLLNPIVGGFVLPAIIIGLLYLNTHNIFKELRQKES
jgi:uncharacterized membrane protein YesL